ncbi:MAG: molybdenum cofactor biosynthesis protein B [Gemmatimonadota bacterium]
MTELPEGTAAHRADAARFAVFRAAVLTVTDSRTRETDVSGDRLAQGLATAGHSVVARELLPNDVSRVRTLVADWIARDDVDVIVITGGTGLGSRDRTIEAVRPLLEKEIPGFGELFRLLGYQEQVGTAAMLSRATAGSARGTLVISLPGSAAAVSLAMDRLILPEAAHLLRDIRR